MLLIQRISKYSILDPLKSTILFVLVIGALLSSYFCGALYKCLNE